MSEIKKIKNFLPEIFHQEIKNLLMSDTFPWYFTNNVAPIDYSDLKEYEKENVYGFGHNIYKNDGENFYQSTFFDFMYPICYFIPDNVFRVLRIRAGMQTKISSNNLIDPPHIDYNFNHMVILYYVNSSDGNTFFYDKNFNVVHENCPEENSAIIFNGNILHSSSHPSKQNARIAININYLNK